MFVWELYVLQLGAKKVVENRETYNCIDDFKSTKQEISNKMPKTLVKVVQHGGCELNNFAPALALIELLCYCVVL